MITDQDEPNQYGLDVSCNLGSIDIHAASKVKDFGKLVDTSMRLLTNVSQMTDIKNVPSVAKANQLMHSVGLGAMNLHGHLVTQGIMYGSKESIDFIDCFMEAMNYYSLKSSMEIAKERGETFYRFEDSDYASGVYFDQYVDKEEQECITDGVKSTWEYSDYYAKNVADIKRRGYAIWLVSFISISNCSNWLNQSISVAALLPLLHVQSAWKYVIMLIAEPFIQCHI